MAHPGNTKGMPKTVLSMSETFKLAEILKARYKQSNLDNRAFAHSINEIPEERQQFRADITHSNVGAVLDAIGMEGNRARPPKGSDDECATFLAGRIAVLEDRVNKLAHTVAQLLPHR